MTPKTKTVVSVAVLMSLLFFLAGLIFVFRVPLAQYAYAKGQRVRPDLSVADRWFRLATFLDRNDEDFWIAWGDAHEERNDLRKAEEKYRVAIDLFPNGSRGYSGLGWIRYRERGFQSAVELQEKAVRAARTNEEKILAYLRLGYAHYGAGNYSEAVGPFEKAYELAPEDFRVVSGLIGAYEKSGQQSKIATRFGNSLDLTVRTNVVLHEASEIADRAQLGEIEKEKAAEEATALVNQALVLFPNDAQVHNGSGVVSLKLGETEKAIAAFKHAIELDNDALYWNNLAAAYNVSGEYNSAIFAARKALETPPRILFSGVEYPRNTWRHLGDAYTNLYRGDGSTEARQSAIFAYQKSLALDPSYDPAARGLESLNQ